MYVYIKDFIMLKALTPGEGAVVGEKVTFLKMPFTMPVAVYYTTKMLEKNRLRSSQTGPAERTPATKTLSSWTRTIWPSLHLPYKQCMSH